MPTDGYRLLGFLVGLQMHGGGGTDRVWREILDGD